MAVFGDRAWTEVITSKWVHEGEPEFHLWRPLEKRKSGRSERRRPVRTPREDLAEDTVRRWPSASQEAAARKTDPADTLILDFQSRIVGWRMPVV